MNERVLMHLSFPRSGQKLSISWPQVIRDDPSDRISPKIMKYLKSSVDWEKHSERDDSSYHD